MQPNGRKTNMNSSSDSNGRKRRIVSGSSSVKKTSDRPVSTNGPVGKKDAYQGRKIQFQKKAESSQQSSAQNTAQNTLFQAASQQNQNQQSTQQTVFTQQSTQGTAASMEARFRQTAPKRAISIWRSRCGWTVLSGFVDRKPS